MSVKSSFFYVRVESQKGEASIHVYNDVSDDRIMMEIDSSDSGIYGKNLSFMLGKFEDEALWKLLDKIGRWIEAGEKAENTASAPRSESGQ